MGSFKYYVITQFNNATLILLALRKIHCALQKYNLNIGQEIIFLFRIVL